MSLGLLGHRLNLNREGGSCWAWCGEHGFFPVSTAEPSRSLRWLPEYFDRGLCAVGDFFGFSWGHKGSGSCCRGWSRSWARSSGSWA